MKKYLNISVLFNFLTILTFGFLFLDSFFYFGFTQKHFFINSQYFLLFYLILNLTLSFFKKFLIHQKLIKLNQIIFPILLIISIVLIYLDKHNYPNFVYTYFHINPNIFLYLPFLSLFIFYLYSNKFFKKTIIFLIIPLISTHLSQFLSFNKSFNFNLLNFNILYLNFPNFRTILINYFLWLIVFLFFISLFKKRYSSLNAFLSFFLIISIVNRYKIKFLGNFFIISDIGLIKNLKEFIPSLVSGTNLKKDLIIILIIFLILFLLFKKLFNTKNPPIKIRLLLFIISVFVVVFPILFPTPFNQILQKCKIETYIPNPIDNCKVNGILFCFYNDFKNINNPPPKDYNQAKINQIYSKIENNLLLSKEVSEFNEEGRFKPNIIIIMSEAFWDVTNLPDVKYSDDPIKNVRKDIKSTFKSPSFGGGTANIEFELLTGLSNFYLKGTTPYSQVVKKTLPTLFTLFKDQDYLTTTIHPFFASMYNRKTVYKNFGLDNFISIENMTDYKTAGPYVSDDSFNKEIIKQLKSTDKQQLIFAISMQNHVTFKANRYSEHPIILKSSLSSNDQDILQSYIDGINLTDKSYLDFKTELNKIKKPTIVFFFGDHLTSLGNGFDIYQKTGLDITNEDKTHTTPLAVWSNYKTDINLPQSISPNFLSLEILKSANITPKYQFAYLNSITSSGTVLNQKLTNKFTPEQLKDYELIQYDLIFGKQYGIK